MQLALFIVFGALALGGALNLLLQRHPIHSALSLVVVMMSLAVLYWSLGAEFLAAAQVIVYSGAIMVLFVFVIMLLNAGKEEHTQGSRVAYSVGFPGAAAIFCLLSFVFLSERGAMKAADIGGDLSSAAGQHRPAQRNAVHPPTAALRGHLGTDPGGHSRRGRAGAEGAIAMEDPRLFITGNIAATVAIMLAMFTIKLRWIPAIALVGCALNLFGMIRLGYFYDAHAKYMFLIPGVSLLGVSLLLTIYRIITQWKRERV